MQPGCLEHILPWGRVQCGAETFPVPVHMLQRHVKGEQYGPGLQRAHHVVVCGYICVSFDETDDVLHDRIVSFDDHRQRVSDVPLKVRSFCILRVVFHVLRDFQPLHYTFEHGAPQWHRVRDGLQAFQQLFSVGAYGCCREYVQRCDVELTRCHISRVIYVCALSRGTGVQMALATDNKATLFRDAAVVIAHKALQLHLIGDANAVSRPVVFALFPCRYDIKRLVDYDDTDTVVFGVVDFDKADDKYRLLSTLPCTEVLLACDPAIWKVSVPVVIRIHNDTGVCGRCNAEYFAPFTDLTWPPKRSAEHVIQITMSEDSDDSPTIEP